MTGTVFRIERFAIHDGPGIRTTVFLKGCPLRCLWCHSPESQSPRPEFMPLPDRCIGCGSCVAACPEHLAAVLSPAPPNAVGARRERTDGSRPDPGNREKTDSFRPDPGKVQKATVSDLTPQECRVCGSCVEACPTGARVLAGEEMTAGAVIEAVERDHLFYDESGGGVTFSGGEPLMQAAFLAALIDECRARGIHAAVDTSGFGDPAALDDIRPDLFLFDLKAMDEARHREITGVSNRVILQNLALIAGRRTKSESPTFGPPDLIVRFPLVPGVTDADDNVRAIGREVASLGIARIDVLPYHRAGLAKYDRLGRPYALRQTEPPTVDRVHRVVDMLSEYGVRVRVGGG